MNAGISAPFSPTIKSERDTWLRYVVEIRAHPPHELKSERKVCGGCVQVHFVEECFSRVFHMKGCRRRLIPGLIPTIRKIEPGKQSSKRQHR